MLPSQSFTAKRDNRRGQNSRRDQAAQRHLSGAATRRLQQRPSQSPSACIAGGARERGLAGRGGAGSSWEVRCTANMNSFEVGARATCSTRRDGSCARPPGSSAAAAVGHRPRWCRRRFSEVLAVPAGGLLSVLTSTPSPGRLAGRWRGSGGQGAARRGEVRRMPVLAKARHARCAHPLLLAGV